MAGEFRLNWAWCFLLWFSSVSVFAVEEFDGEFIVLATQKNSSHHKQARRKLDDVSGSISIDCGLPEELGYTDRRTEIPYTSDSKFINTGINQNISAKFISETLQRTFENVRSFPEGKRNCYALKPPRGRKTVYLVRASFMYGDYDGLNHLPQFDLYMGVNLWDTVKFDNASHVVIKEILHVPLMDDVYVCLLNTDRGTPFISALELRHFHNSTYRSQSGSLALYGRFDMGSTTNTIVRYNEDAYDRIWFPYNIPGCTSLNTNFTIDTLDKTEYQPPSTVMRTAVRPRNGDDSLEFLFDTGDSISEFYVYMHFAEIEELQENEHREFDITLNGNLWYRSEVPRYLYSSTIYSTLPIRGPKLLFSLHKKPNSTLPPILNAIEIYSAKDFLQASTDQEDVNAMVEIKQTYISFKSWQGDPCAPMYSSWDRLNCSYKGYDAPRIIALNLASSSLSGTISLSFTKLKSLEYLDLSNNSLTGPVPDFLLQLPHLRTLNLSENRLSGVIPSLLKEKSDNGSLLLSVDGNRDLCLMAPCKEDKNNNFPLLAAILPSIAFVIVLGIVVSIIWRWRCNRKPAANRLMRTSEEVVLKSNNKQFSYSQIVAITNNFQKMIGKGGFGTVYHGYLSDDTQVAVKMLSLRSPEGSKQFQTEAELLMRIHHRNLAAFLGYCNEVGHAAIIYEFMAYGNLEECLSGSREELSSWKHRIQIAVNAAQGLEYLHDGCKPPIIHRDIKTANILLNEKMQAKVADFGFSRFFSAENESHISTTVVGTFGYLDPEYYSSNRLTEKSDVYSFGIVLLELITGQPAIIKGPENTHIVTWVTHFLARGDLQQIVDPRLQGDFDSGSMWKAVEAAIACVPPVAIQRPSISYIVTELKECLEMEAACEQTRGTDEKMLKSNYSFGINVVDLEAVSGPEAR